MDKDTSTKSSKSLPWNRTLLQPLLLLLIAAVFITVFLTIGKLPLQQANSALIQYAGTNGSKAAKDLEKQVAEFYGFLGSVQPGIFDPSTGTLQSDDFFDLEENFINGLIELIRDLGWLKQEDRLDQDTLAAFLHHEGLTAAAFYDDTGQVVLRNKPIPEAIVDQAAAVIRGHSVFSGNVFSHAHSKDKFHYIALRPDSGRGSVVLFMDAESFRYQRFRFCVAQALEKTAWSTETQFVTVVDKQGRILGSMGDNPTKQGDWNRSGNLLPNEDDLAVYRISSGAQSLLEIVSPLVIQNAPTGVTRIEMNSVDLAPIIARNHSNTLMTVLIVAGITALSMILLYKNQQRHVETVRQMEQRIQQAERLSALGRLGAGLAHEIRNPLNAIAMAAQKVQRQQPHPLIAIIRDEVRRLNRTIEEFLVIARGRKLESAPRDLKSVLEQVVLLMKDEAADQGIHIDTQWPEANAVVLADSDKLKQAFLNLLRNAMESISGEGLIVVTLSRGGGGWYRIEVIDTGTGIDGNQIKHIFDLDYTTKDKGLGFGLPLAHEIIIGHGGEIRVRSAPGVGTTFEIRLPAYSEA